jgi:hypothetical protein
MSGKKVVRMKLSRQICVDELMAMEIKHRADRGFRSQEDEIRFLIHLGLEREDQMYSNDTQDTFTQQPSLFSTRRIH